MKIKMGLKKMFADQSFSFSIYGRVWNDLWEAFCSFDKIYTLLLVK